MRTLLILNDFMLRYWRIGYRFSLLLFHILVGIFISVFSQFISPKLSSHEITRNRLVRWWFIRLIAIFHLRVKLLGNPSNQTVLIVSNHISWLDIVVLGSFTSGSFVSKAEIRHWPVIGFLAAAADTAFIERGERRSFEAVVTGIAELLKRGRSVFIFPEGTTSDGKQVLKFRRRLFKAAIDANVPIQTATIRYFKHEEIHPTIPYVGNDSMWDNLMRLLQEPFVDVELYFETPLPAIGSEAELARHCWTQVTAHFSNTR